jgi:hypothetical protein
MTRDQIIEAMARAIDPGAFEHRMGQSKADRSRKDATAALAAIEAAGAVIVPREPTGQMLAEANRVVEYAKNRLHGLHEARYAAMLNASPFKETKP